MPTTNENKKLIDAINNLSAIIDDAKYYQAKDYSQTLNVLNAYLKEIGNGTAENGCLYKIHHELRTLNKTIIMAALLISATKNPEQTLQEYSKIINLYLN